MSKKYAVGLSPRLTDVVRRLSPRMLDVLVAIHRGEGAELPSQVSNTVAALRDRGLVEYEGGLRLTEDGAKAAVAILAGVVR